MKNIKKKRLNILTTRAFFKDKYVTVDAGVWISMITAASLEKHYKYQMINGSDLFYFTLKGEQYW